MCDKKFPVFSDSRDEDPPIERAAREAALELALETGDAAAAETAARNLLRALRLTAAKAKPNERENAAALFLLLSRRVCEKLCGTDRNEDAEDGGQN